MSDPREIVTRRCACDRRREAQSLTAFVYLSHHRAWVFTDAAPRHMSESARYYAFAERHAFPHEDHSGEPFRWVSCPFCGHDLPGTDDLATARETLGDPDQ